MKQLWAAVAVIAVLSSCAARAEGHRWTIRRQGKSGTAGTTFRLRRHPVVALTFDDLPAGGGLAPGDSRTRIATSLVSELKAHHLKGVYGFVNAIDVDDDPDMQHALRIWVGAGMNLGSHTWSHPSLNDLTAEAFESEIARNEPVLAQFAGKRNWHWFRYPYLYEGDTQVKREAVRGWLREHGYRIAQVTLNFDDDAWDDPYGRCMAVHNETAIAWLKQSYLEDAAEYLRVGREEEIIAFGHEVPNVLLLHENPFTTLMMPELFKVLKQQGFRFKSLRSVERNPVYAKDVGYASRLGGSLPDQFLNAHRLAYPPLTPLPEAKLDKLCR
ncbi:MAG TPA: polysaccharide deacetylase family protein [Terracidiphilus sp.]|nr:polysaccharide deacetylase family protein [Terracidiphilus sp.]